MRDAFRSRTGTQILLSVIESREVGNARSPMKPVICVLIIPSIKNNEDINYDKNDAPRVARWLRMKKMKAPM